MAQTKRGVALVMAYLLVVLVTAYGSAMMVQSLTEHQVVQRHLRRGSAFQLAEAGVDEALFQLQADYNWTGPLTAQVVNAGTYTTQAAQNGTLRKITSTAATQGTIVSSNQIETWVQKHIPSNFYDEALYSANNISFKGNAYSVTGDILAAGSISSTNGLGGVAGNYTTDPSASPLARLDYQQLYNIALSQGNVYDATRLKNIQKNTDSFPGAFCFSPPTDPNDPSTCTPNVNYVTDDLVLNGNIGTVGGFFVVVGNVLTDPSAVEDTTIEGNGQVAGAIYTTGTFKIKGGGSGLNLDGGVWSGEKATLDGSATIQYNAAYMNAIKNLQINPGVQLISWRECPPAGCS